MVRWRIASLLSYMYIPVYMYIIVIHISVLPVVLLYFSDSIESNVETAAVRVESGNKQLERAVVYKVSYSATYPPA